MCLAVPGKIKKVGADNFALVDFMGVEKRIAMDLLESPQEGEYVIVHAGFAITLLEEDEALETLAMLDQISKLGEQEQA